MCSLAFKLSLIFFYFLTSFIKGSIDINLAEFQYISDHLSEKECFELVAALHFHSFELPKDINAAERRIPEGIPCLDLLLHWNSTPREGRGETHTEVCHRLNQIGREDLAVWLSKTVFHQISKDLKVVLNVSGPGCTTIRQANIKELHVEVITDEAPWWEVDSLLEILIVFGIVALLAGSLFLCFLCFLRTRKPQENYERLPAQEF